MTPIALRPAAPADSELCYQLHKAAMGDYITAIWGTPAGLAAFTGANTSAARNPYAVLAARLSPAELPAPPARPTRPPWCGECDELTRMLGFDGDAPRPCPRCKPTAR